MGIDLSPANVSRSVPAVDASNPSSSKASASINKVAHELWKKMFDESIKSSGGITQALQGALSNADELACSLVGQPANEELQRDIEATLSLLERHLSALCSGRSQGLSQQQIDQLKEMSGLLDQIKVQLALTGEALAHFSAQRNQFQHIPTSSLSNVTG